MADFDSFAGAGRSIVRLLNLGFTEANPHPTASKTSAVLIRTEDFKNDASNTTDGSPLTPPAVSIFFYRVDFNRTMRAPWSAVGNYEGRAHLPVDMHFLLTPWAENAEYELRLLGRAMQILETHPILTGPLLDPMGSWAPSDAVQLCLAEITTEEVMRTFDSLPVDFKLSVPYVARVIRISEQIARPAANVGRVDIGTRGLALADPPLVDSTLPEDESP
jgi:hypothetical protein